MWQGLKRALGLTGDPVVQASPAIQTMARLGGGVVTPPESFGDKVARAISLLAAAKAYQQTGNREQALEAGQDALVLARELCSDDPVIGRRFLATSLYNLGIRLIEMGRREEALRVTQEAVLQYRELARVEPQVFLPVLARCLNVLGVSFGGTGRREEALQVIQEAMELDRELALDNPQTFLPALAVSLHNLSIRLSEMGRREEALKASQEAVQHHRELVQANRPAFLPKLAKGLGNLGVMLSELGRCNEALEATREAVQLGRELVQANPQAFLSDLAMNLNTLGAMFSEMGNHDEALPAAQEAVQLYRELVITYRQALLPYLAMSLNNLGIRLQAMGRADDALQAAREAVQLGRELVQANPQAFLPDLAKSLNTLCAMLCDVGRRDEAMEVTRESVQHYRDLARAHPLAFLPDLAMSLNNLGTILNVTGRRDEAISTWREAGGLVLRMPAEDPNRWNERARLVLTLLNTPVDVLDFHVPLLSSLTERRELSHNAEHAWMFLATQAELVKRIWGLLREHGATHPRVMECAPPVLIAALHSPDLAQWLEVQLEVRADDESPAARLRHELACIKREVIAADEAYHGLLARFRGSSGGFANSGPGLSELRDEPGPSTSPDELKRAADKAERCRQDYRAKRTELIAADPAFRGTFEVSTVQALRDDLRTLSSQGVLGADSGATSSALLCLMTLKEAEHARAVGVLFSEAGRTPHLIEFPGLVDLADEFARYEPEGDRGGDASGPRPTYRRGPSTGEDAPVHATPPPQPALDDLASQLQDLFWRPLQDALRWTSSQDSPCAVLHVCGHGPLHQLPLAALAAQFAQAQLQLVQWPGLPYFRIAATGTAQEGEAAPWQLGHDCAWQQDQPLPMVAVEAHLLGALLDGHGRRVQWLSQASELQAHCAALVACCHGQHAAHFDSALALGELPLAVESIVAERLGPRAVLLPVCHAGETAEDAAGNALGVAAGFLLGGTRVVVASAKAVPDMVIPWFSTLMAWHMVAEDMGPYQAAVLARGEFGSGEFPQAYREWLQQVLPQALQTIQPGGAEWPAITEACRVKAARSDVAEVPPAELVWWVAELWPWAGEPLLLFEDDPAKREAARQAAARHVLQPRSDDYGQEVRRMMREAAAFIFIYGCG